MPNGNSPLVDQISSSTGLDPTTSAQSANTAAALVIVPFTVMHRPAGGTGGGTGASGGTGATGGAPSHGKPAMMAPPLGVGGDNGNGMLPFSVTAAKLVEFLAATEHIRPDQAATVLRLVGAELQRITQVATMNFAGGDGGKGGGDR